MLDWLTFSHTVLRFCLFIFCFFSVCFSWIVLIALSSSLLIFFPAVSKLLFNLSREFHFANILFISSRIYIWFFFIDFFLMKFLLMKHPLLLITLPSSPNSPIFIFIIKTKLNLALSKPIEKVSFSTELQVSRGLTSQSCPISSPREHCPDSRQKLKKNVPGRPSKTAHLWYPQS